MTDLPNYRRYVSSKIAFNYCGMGANATDAATASNGLSIQTLGQSYRLEHKWLGKEKSFFEKVRDFEMLYKGRSHEERERCALCLSKELISMKHLITLPTQQYPYSKYWENLRMLLYSIERIANSCKLSSEETRTLLNLAMPAELFAVNVDDCNWIVAGRDFLMLERLFRESLPLSRIMDGENFKETECHLDADMMSGKFVDSKFGKMWVQLSMDSRSRPMIVCSRRKINSRVRTNCWQAVGGFKRRNQN